MLSRAYSLLTIKSVDDDERIITGIATTPEPDRYGDIVESKGAQFKLPIPLLWQHNAREPIGHVFAAKVTNDGIEIKARFVKIDEPGKLKDRIDESWQSVKSGLVSGLSIGFNAIESARIEQTFAYRFVKWLWLELSVVTIPANGDCSITAVKSLDAAYLAESGRGEVGVARHTPPVGGKPVALSATRRTTNMKKSLTDQIKDFEATKAAKVDERKALMETAGETGVTLDGDQAAKYDELSADIKSIDQHLGRLKALEEENRNTAAPVKGNEPAAAAVSREPVARISVTPNTEPGIGFARAVLCKAAAFSSMQRGEFKSALDYAKERWPDDTRVQRELQTKTAVAAGTTTDSTWALPLAADAQTLASEFLAYLRPATIVGKFGTTQNGVSIPSLRRVPFNVRIQAQSVAGSASWVGQGKPKPVTKFGYTSVTLGFTKIAAITVITDELARFSNPSAEALVRDQLREVVVARMDSDFINPAISETSNVRPASVTNGLTALTSAGTSAANVITDLQNLIEPFILAKVPIGDIVLIMPETLALVLSLMQNSLGQREFDGMTVAGGSLRGFPVITTQYAADEDSRGNMVIAVNARDVALADDGQVTVDASREASLQMDDSPTNDASTGTGQSLVSMWQTNSIALRAERVICWKKLRDSAVVYYDDVNWGSIGSPV